MEHLIPFVSYVLAVLAGMLIMRVIYSLNISKANVNAAKIIEDANTKADNLVKEAILDGKNQAYELKLEAEKIGAIQIMGIRLSTTELGMQGGMVEVFAYGTAIQQPISSI